MIRYFCKQCNMETKFSECPVCGERTELAGTSVYWCKSCKIPTYDEICPICGQKGKHLTTDIRPVYPAEPAFRNYKGRANEISGSIGMERF